MKEYVAKRVSPGDKLILNFNADGQLDLRSMGLRTLEVLKAYFKSDNKEVVEEFSHIFSNLEPPFVTLVIAVGIGYGDLVLEYHSFIINKPTNEKEQAN